MAAQGTASRSKVALAACTGAASQQWRVGTGASLVNLGSGMCLDDPYSRTANGIALWIYTCHGTLNQKSTLTAGPVLSAVAGQCLDDAGRTLADFNKIAILPGNRAPAQRVVPHPAPPDP